MTAEAQLIQVLDQIELDVVDVAGMPPVRCHAMADVTALEVELPFVRDLVVGVIALVFPAFMAVEAKVGSLNIWPSPEKPGVDTAFLFPSGITLRGKVVTRDTGYLVATAFHCRAELLRHAIAEVVGRPHPGRVNVIVDTRHRMTVIAQPIDIVVSQWQNRPVSRFMAGVAGIFTPMRIGDLLFVKFATLQQLADPLWVIDEFAFQ